MMIIEYAVLSLALHYPCKEYQIICESAHSYLCTCMRNKYQCKCEFSLFSVQGNIYLVLFQDCCSFVLRHLCPVHKINAQLP